MKLFRKKNKESKDNSSLIGERAELIHDATVFQYGTVMIDGERYSVKLEDDSELCVGNMVEVIGIKDTHLIVRKS